MGKKSESRNPYYKKANIQFVIDLVKKGSEVTVAAREMCNHFDLQYRETVGRHYRHILQKAEITNNTVKLEDNPVFKAAQKREFDPSKKRFIITWAQAETPVNQDFLNNIEAYAEAIDAEIHVIAGRYKNPTSLEASEKQENKERNKSFWDTSVEPYLDANRQNIHQYLSIFADLKIQPTASTPLSGLNGLSSLESCIIGHPAVHMASLPVLDGYPNKLLLTTGALTYPNYTDTKAGAKGAFNHQFGFVIVELDGDIFHVRQIQATEDGSFYDLKSHVADGFVVSYEAQCPAIVWGDVHYGHHNERALQVSVDMAEDFNVKEVIVHDIFDGKSVSHHEINNPFLQLENERNGTGNLMNEIENIVQFFNEHKNLNFIAVRSNHDDFLDRWLINVDWRKNPNREAFLFFAMATATGVAPKGVIPYVLEDRCKNVKALGINDSHRILGWETGIHGHLGANGSRGTAIQFKNLNTKTITGHTHSPIRVEGHASVGTLTEIRVGYNNGATSWMNTNILMYPNGKISHINIIKGKYTTLY